MSWEKPSAISHIFACLNFLSIRRLPVRTVWGFWLLQALYGSVSSVYSSKTIKFISEIVQSVNTNHKKLHSDKKKNVTNTNPSLISRNSTCPFVTAKLYTTIKRRWAQEKRNIPRFNQHKPHLGAFCEKRTSAGKIVSLLRVRWPLFAGSDDCFTRGEADQFLLQFLPQ